jgi:tRNA dimethylallyltransferase
MPPRAEVIALFGPTGVGKTAVALSLAARLRELGEDPVAVSADALQIYAGLETLTGAANPAERLQLEHRLISFVPVTEPFSAGRYAELAHAEIDTLLAQGRRPIVVGGTGLYLRAALAELALSPPPAPGVRERLMAELAERGPQALHTRLADIAPWRAAQIDAGDSHRIVRALELQAAGALTPHAPESQLWTQATRHPTLLVGLMMDREQLYGRIDARVEAMVAAGAVEEVRQAAAAGAGETARQALGFSELLAGDVEAMQRHTRNYARRQLTWLRKLPGAWLLDLEPGGEQQAADEVAARWRVGRYPPAP